MFRDDDGELGLLDRHCPHRGADLCQLVGSQAAHANRNGPGVDHALLEVDLGVLASRRSKPLEVLDMRWAAAREPELVLRLREELALFGTDARPDDGGCEAVDEVR